MWRTSSVPFISNSRPLVMAHRGDSANVPENTSIAFIEAGKLDVDVIETDVHITRDNHLVFFHDNKLDNTTDGKGKITAKILTDLEKLDLGYRFDPEGNGTFPYRNSGLKIQLVRDVLETFPQMRFNMDIKDKEKAAPIRLAELIEELGAQDRVQVGSFHQGQINAFRKLSQAPTSAGPFETLKYLKTLKRWIKRNNQQIKNAMKAQVDNTGNNSMNNSMIELTQNDLFGENLPFISLTIPMGIPLNSFNPKIKFISPEIIYVSHLINIAVFVWTINKKEHMETLIEWDIDGIFTDKPGVLIDVLKERGFA